jgi:hypothetical protein
MTLNWSTQSIKHFKDNPDDLWVKYSKGTPDEYEDVNAETKSLIFGSMSLGLGSIKYSNINKWWARWKIYEKYDSFYLYSKFVNNEIEKVYLTKDVLLKHVGLSMNVSEEADAKWATRVHKYLLVEHKDLAEVLTLPKLRKEMANLYDEFEVI